MTSYNGQSITYDEIGNPLTYRDGMTMTWTGRQLRTLTQNGKQNTYKYDVDGLRLEKTAGGVTTQYQYVNGQLLGEKRSNGVILRYTYDALGVLSGIQYKNAAGVTTNYIVRCTLSGDVDQIYDTKGSLLARYIYDTWGNTLSVTDASGKAITDPLHIANINPIRYRGYYYDAETGLYYLQSRYYDVVTKRFLNADELLGANAGAAYNLFAYCGNEPVNRMDSLGTYPIEVGDKSTSHRVALTISEWKQRNERQKINQRNRVINNIVSTANVVLSSPTINFGIGFGLYGDITDVVSGGEKFDFLQISMSFKDGIMIGQQKDAGFEIGMPGFSSGVMSHQYTRIAGFDSCIRHPHSFCTCKKVFEEETAPTGNFTFGAAAYILAGANFSVDIDIWQVMQDIIEIWD